MHMGLFFGGGGGRDKDESLILMALKIITHIEIVCNNHVIESHIIFAVEIATLNFEKRKVKLSFEYCFTSSSKVNNFVHRTIGLAFSFSHLKVISLQVANEYIIVF